MFYGFVFLRPFIPTNNRRCKITLGFLVDSLQGFLKAQVVGGSKEIGPLWPLLW